jgi:dihydrofolate reductase
MARFWKTIDTVVMGRKTWEVAVKSGAIAYPGVKTFVCSRKLKKSRDATVEIARDAARLVRKLKQSRGKGICVMCGGELARSLLQSGLLDEVRLNVHPVLLGSGIPLFHRMRRQIDLELVESRRLKRDCALLTYRVRG